ncbi:F-box protein [Prunus yedoensis var. nudiflora]|uniref:F-box protein n=1 Tax=Prunus yedoensis var. nudiflora TaxID=2094558 RepID=A0A314UF69_PRUYE|nr:F-box protein [Prunus yedoensis var. nudiflora]
MMANWSELQPELLQLIMNNLSFVNILRFRAVCSSWNHAAKSCATSSCPPPRTPSTPWLMLPSSSEENDQNNPASGARCFYSLEEQKVYTIKSSFQDFDHAAAWCVGSSHGWLIFNSKANLHLLNPISPRKIQLPPMWHIAKAVLYLLRPDSEQLFALAGDGSVEGSVEVWEFNKSFPIKTIDLPQPFAEIEKADIMQNFSIYKYSTQNYLVESLGEILYVGRVIGNFINHEGIAVVQEDLPEGFDVIFPYRTLRFYILKLNITGKKWEKVESSLRNRALFLGGNQSMSVSTRDFPELEENSIYFTDDRLRDINFQFDCSGHDNGVYNIGNKVVKPFDQLD